MEVRLTEHHGGLFDLKGYTDIEEIDVYYFSREEGYRDSKGGIIHNIMRDSRKLMFGVESSEIAKNCIYNLLSIETNALLNRFPELKVTETLREGRASKLVGKHITTNHFN